MMLRFRAGLAVGSLLFLSVLPIQANPDSTLSINAHVISAGSSARLASPCYRLTATIAEPVVGFLSGGGFSLNGGFLAHDNAATGDAIFFSGFEDCTP